MSVFCRESLFPYMKNLSDFFFELIVKGIDMYEKFFGYDFPFNKYDQIFCPEYNWGAMENAGVVTFNDDYVWREEVDAYKMTWLGDCITHELAHHCILYIFNINLYMYIIIKYKFYRVWKLSYNEMVE